jgi:hypothetical protein
VALGPALRIAQIDGPHGVRRKPKLQRHTPRRCTLASRPDRIPEALAERRLAGQLQHPLRLYAAARAAQPLQFDHHRGQVLEAGKIANFPLIRLGDCAHQLTASRTDQLLVTAFAPRPQLQPLGRFVDLGTVHLYTQASPVSSSSRSPLWKSVIGLPESQKNANRSIFRFLHRADFFAYMRANLQLICPARQTPDGGIWKRQVTASSGWRRRPGLDLRDS